MGELKLEAVSLDGTGRMTLFDNSDVEDSWREYQVNAPALAFDYRVSHLQDCKQHNVVDNNSRIAVH